MTNMRDILLIQPRIGNLDSVNKHPSLPLGLLSISRYLIKNYRVKIIDQRIEKDWKKQLGHELKKNPLFVALTIMAGPQVNYAIQVSRLIRKLSKVKIIWGGPFPTFYKECIKLPYVDIIVRGEGEITINKLAKAIESNNILKNVDGISFKLDGKIIHNRESPLLKMDSLPLIPLNIIDFNKYIYRYKRGKREISYCNYETSRGCSNNCCFCRNSSNIPSTKWRGFSARDLFLGVKRLFDGYGINYFYFVDDNFFADSGRVKEFCRIISKNTYGFEWIASGTVKGLSCYSQDSLDELYNCGCRVIHIGLESGSQKIIDSMQKEKFSVNDAIILNRRLKDSGIIPYYDILLGYYGETLGDIRKTTNLLFRLIKDNNNAQFSALHCLNIYKSTKLYNFAIRNNLLKKHDINFKCNNWGKANVPWVSQKRKKLLEHLYFCSLFIDNKNELIDSRIIKVFSKLYRPIALYRIRNLNFKFMFEDKLLNLPYIFN